MRWLCAVLVLAPALGAAQATEAKEPAPKAEDAGEKPADERAPVRMRSASLMGVTGLDQVWSADPGPEGTFRLRYGLDYSAVEDWPLEDYANTFVRNDFAFAYTPIEYLELFLDLRNTSNTNNGSKPAHIATQGDLTFGLKGGWFVTDAVGIGAAVGLRLVGGIDGGGPVGGATSPEFRVLGTFDLDRAKLAPVRLMLDFSYTVENGEAIYEDAPSEPDIVQDWALQAPRYDRLMVGIGLEGLVEPWVAPFIEYRIGTPFLVQTLRQGEGSNEFAFASVPHFVTPGVRAFPLENLAVELAVRVGLSDQPFTGVPASPPWELAFGLAYTLDPRPKIIEKEVEAKAPPPPPKLADGGIKGVVKDAKSGKPVPGARVTYPGKPLSAQVADRNGRFEGYRFEPGEVAVRVDAEGYAPRKAKAVVVANKDTSMAVQLEALAKGRVEVRVFDDLGKPMAARIEVDDELAGESTADTPYVVEVRAGKHKIVVGAPRYETVTKEIEVPSGETASVRVPLVRGSGKPGKRSGKQVAPAPRSGGGAVDRRELVELRGTTIRLKRPISFAGRSARLTADSTRVLDELADLLKDNQQLRAIRIVAHTDNRGDPGDLETLSNERARSVRSHLVKRGVEGKRLATRGYGGKKPIAPNLTSRGREKNNRIEFLVLE